MNKREGEEWKERERQPQENERGIEGERAREREDNREGSRERERNGERVGTDRRQRFSVAE